MAATSRMIACATRQSLFKGAQGHRASLARRARCRRPRPPPRRGLASGGSSASRRPAETLSLLESSSYSPITVDLRPSRAIGHPRGHVEVRAQTSDVRAAALNHSRGCSEQIGQPIALEIDAILDFECMGLSGAQTLVQDADARLAARL